jgi:hypothetical protein
LRQNFQWEIMWSKIFRRTANNRLLNFVMEDRDKHVYLSFFILKKG